MAGNDTIQTLLNAGIQAARDKDRVTGRQLLQQVIDAEPNNEMAWLWMASCVTTLRERRDCLEQVLLINPDNPRAQEALNRLSAASAQQAQQQAQPDTRRDAIDLLRQEPSQGEQPRAKARARVREEARGSSGGRVSFLTISLILLLGIASVLAVLFAPEVGLLTNSPTATTVLLHIPPSATARLVVNTNTPGGEQPAIVAIATLPATYTPTPEPTATATPLPSPTPYPLSEFKALLTSMEPGAIQPTLYEINGDGGQETALSGNIRDFAYAPDGRQIAFIRDVQYPPAEGESEPRFLPELYVGDINNLADARPITSLQTAWVGDPTWSPESNAIIFASDQDGDRELYFITAGGDNLRQITSNDSADHSPAWSPVLGSKSVLFVSNMDDYGQMDIYLMQMVDPEIMPEYDQLTDTGGSSYAPAWSPNGQQIAFVSDRSNDADIYIMLPDGRDETVVTRDDGDAEDRNPSYTPDGRFIAFTSNRQDDLFQTYLVSPEGDVLQRITNTMRDDILIVFRLEPALFGQ